MKITVSTSISGLLRSVPLKRALELTAQAGFTGIDFPIHLFCKSADAPLLRKDWRLWALKVREAVERMGVAVVQAHAPWTQTIPEDFSPAEPDIVCRRAVAVCRLLGCDKLIFHPPLRLLRLTNEDDRARVHRWNTDWFRSLLPDLQAFGVTVLLENGFDFRRIQQPGDPPFLYTRAEDMLALLSSIRRPEFALCLDTGHANLAGQNIPAWILAAGPEIRALRLNDNYGPSSLPEEDLHQLPGFGALDWSAVFAALKASGYAGAWSLEPIGALPFASDATRVIALRAGREIVEQLAKEAGF